MWRIALFGFLLLGFSRVGYPENRFDIKLEYELIDACVERSRGFRKMKAVDICICALQKTMENGWGPDYDDSEDFREDEEGFLQAFGVNIVTCQKSEE